MKTLTHPNAGENNPSYKGEKAGYGAIHAWVRRRLPKPKKCQRCKWRPPADLANKSGKYLRDLIDWEYLCRKCHMDSDGRNERLRQSGKSRRLPMAICPICAQEYGATKNGQLLKHCSRACWIKSSLGKVRNPNGKNGARS